jgi:hypothetical protein
LCCERITCISIISYGKIHFDIRVFWITSAFLERIMLAIQSSTVLGAVRISRLPGCSLKTDEGLKKLGQGADDYRIEAGTNVTAQNGMTTSPVYLVSSYKGTNPVEE